MARRGLRRTGDVEPGSRCLAIVVARDEEAVGAVVAGIPERACGLPVDVLLVDDGSRDRTVEIAREHGARVHSHPVSRGLGAALRTGLEAARDGVPPPSTSTATASTTRATSSGSRAGRPRASRLCPRLALPRPARRHELAPRVGQPRHERPPRPPVGDGDQRRPDRLPRLSARALAAARIAHDYNYAQVLTLSLWSHGIEPVGRSATGAARAGAHSSAIRSTWRVWPRRSGASGESRVPPAGRGRPRRHRSPPPARTAIRRRW